VVRALALDPIPSPGLRGGSDRAADLGVGIRPPDVAAQVPVLAAQRYRSQDRNRDDALSRLQELVARAASVPPTRKATRPTRASQRRRVDGKVLRGRIKAARGKVVD
jgi:hypothetical protein